ncbi:hypothetical protein [Paenibacillus agricola]|uniref:Uncharacterized protein n=1 Tax=Paenibacillus agricola TaxID=2716264 RepID=A0ABX0IXM6_9BACL|nr:hypothetical protein [Paenibacillus agricola]NHN28281.1 hypothetical protein [Paenibacillus agricola]
MKNDGVTKEELELLLSKKQSDSLDALEMIKHMFMPRAKRHRKKKKWPFPFNL